MYYFLGSVDELTLFMLRNSSTYGEHNVRVVYDWRSLVPFEPEEDTVLIYSLESYGLRAMTEIQNQIIMRDLPTKLVSYE